MAFDNKACLDVMKSTHELIENNKSSFNKNTSKKYKIISRCTACGAPLNLKYIITDNLCKCEYCDSIQQYKIYE